MAEPVDSGRIGAALREELNGGELRLWVATALSGVLPDLVGNRCRTALFRMAGVAIGTATVIGGQLTIAGGSGARRRVVIGRRGWINAGCHLDASDQVHIGDDVAIAQGVIVITQTHDVGGPSRRAGALKKAPVVIGDGCWLGARTVVLPGVTIGHGAIVAAGAVVARDVPPDTMVAGVPARAVRELR